MSKVHIYLYGLHSIQSLLARQPERIVRVYVQSGRVDQRLSELVQSARCLGLGVEQRDTAALSTLASSTHHQGVVAEVTECARQHEQDLQQALAEAQKPLLLLVLDGVQDPHNLGACLRTADAAGVDWVIAPKDKSAGLTPAVYKVASGAAVTQRFVQVTNLARTLGQLKEQGVWCYGAAEEASLSLHEADFSTGSVAWVLGSEAKGLRRLTRECCDQLVSIPMLGEVSSLNVSVAAGLCLYEVVRQRGPSA